MLRTKLFQMKVLNRNKKIWLTIFFLEFDDIWRDCNEHTMY